MIDFNVPPFTGKELEYMQQADEKTARTAAHAKDDARVLDRVVRIVKPCAHDAHLGPLAIGQKLLHPFRRDHGDIVVEAEDIVPFGVGNTEIVDGGIVKLFIPVDHPHTVFCRPVPDNSPGSPGWYCCSPPE